MNKIQCFEGQYNKALFYAKVGQFFAEDRYIRQLPYLRNIERKDQVAAFSSLYILDTYILFTTEHMEPTYRRQGLFNVLGDFRFDYCSDWELPIRIFTSISFIRDDYIQQGFEMYRESKNDWFLVLQKEVSCYS